MPCEAAPPAAPVALVAPPHASPAGVREPCAATHRAPRSVLGRTLLLDGGTMAAGMAAVAGFTDVCAEPARHHVATVESFYSEAWLCMAHWPGLAGQTDLVPI